MKIYMIGLGKMGLNLALNMQEKGYEVIGYDIKNEMEERAIANNIQVINDVNQIKKDGTKKIVWLMLPAGKITNNMIVSFSQLLLEGDILIDGGNSDYRDSISNGQLLLKSGILFFDIGTSGGVYGARHGASFMVGGDKKGFNLIEPLLTDISAPNGLLYTGKSGSGHYLKIIHNAILHSELEILGEGFDLLNSSQFEYNLKDVAYNWSKSSVIRGWLMDLLYDAFCKKPKLDDVETTIHSSSACIDAINSAMKLNVPVPMMGITLLMRQRTQQQETFSARIVNSLRKEIGGYKPKK